jgi:phage tail-like protein
MPQVGELWETYLTDQFIITVDQTDCPGISKISGLSLGELDTVEQPDAYSNHVYKIASGRVKFESLTVERYVTGSNEDQYFMDWWRSTFNLNSPTQGGSTVRKNGLITKKHNGEVVLKMLFKHAWIKKASFSDLEAGSTNHFKQTIVLEHEGLEVVFMKQG